MGRIVSLFVIAIGLGLAMLSSSARFVLADDEKPLPRDETRSAAEADEAKPSEVGGKWNEYDGKLLTVRLGGGLLVDTATYAQGDDSKKQMHLEPAIGLRDFRLLLKGRFKFLPRVSYSLGYMYDAAVDLWRFRQTGLMIKVPELNGDFFVGRTKEGFSTNKLMVGYYGWANERAVANDAFLPILADGIKWTGNAIGNKLVYNLGWFVGSLGNQSYVKNDHQFAARAVWLPLVNDQGKRVLHLAVEGRYGAAKNGNLQFRSKPESFPAQSYAVDSGKFAAESATTVGLEAYFQPGQLTLGSEYFFNPVSSPQKGDPFLHGGEVFAAYLFPGGTRPYNTRGAFFDAVTPTRSVFAGGPGAWEAVLRYSYADLDSGAIQGGKFWRVTPMVNWHLSDNMRFELVYGYGVLDRFGVKGGTQFIQTRLQLTL